MVFEVPNDRHAIKKAFGRQTSGFALPENPAKVSDPEPRENHFYMTRVLEDGNVAARWIRCLGIYPGPREMMERSARSSGLDAEREKGWALCLTQRWNYFS
jgi:hypothetical protein